MDGLRMFLFSSTLSLEGDNLLSESDRLSGVSGFEIIHIRQMGCLCSLNVGGELVDLRLQFLDQPVIWRGD